MTRRIPLSALILLVCLPALAGPRALAEDPPAAPTPDAERALEDLASPFERTRNEAVRRLVAGLPGSRDAVIAALPGASPAVKVHLVEVLAADGSLPGIRALLRAMNEGDEALAVRIRRVLIRHVETARRVLEAWEADPSIREGEDGTVSRRTRDLEGLLRRAEVERLFVTRKSRTGSTGSYRGQYDVLKPYRKEALALCVGLITDRAVKVPGVYTAGTFSFLRPLPVHVEPSELRGMAAHAFAELGRPDDFMQVATLRTKLVELWDELERLSYYDDVRFRDLLNQYADLLVALYLVVPDRLEARLEDFLSRLGDRGDFRWKSALGTSYRPIVLLRVGRYEEAIEELDFLLRTRQSLSEAGAHYNLACAYAQWGSQLAKGVTRERKLATALVHLELAVENQWLDIGWMEQDRDLEPIRDTPGYRILAKRVRRELDLDDE